MCRSAEEGGRRCPNCGSESERATHNARRRQNRAARSAIVSWARAEGVPDEAISLLAKAPPSVAKRWAREAGAPASLLEDPPPASSAREMSPREVSDIFWVGPDVLPSIIATAAQQGRHPRERALLDAEVAGLEWAEESGVNETIRVRLTDGSDAYHKPFDGLDEEASEDYGHDGPLQPVHEVAAWALARELGGPWDELVPPCVLREIDGRLGSLSMGVPGNVTNPLPVVPEERILAAGFFDALIGQQDRHGGNLLVDKDRLYLIDHGFAFARTGDGYNLQLLQQRRVFHAPQLTDGERGALHRLVGSPDLLGVAPLLQGDRADALRARAEIMLASGRVLPGGWF